VKTAFVPAVFAALVLPLLAGPTVEAGSNGGKGSKGGPQPGWHPGTNQHNHHHHHHHHPTYGQPAPVVLAPYQNVRYLRVVNNTGENLTVHVRGGDGRTRSWNIPADQKGYLAVDNVRIAESQVGIWAEAPGKVWTGHKDGLTLVAAPYRASGIGTFIYTFN
jgi:hypothetical protein